ncbi:MAG: ABC transporter permease [Bacteroidetes bacterium]|nr:MAG: ABC transporter permease [Bacteroidota bacterium]
MFDLDKWQEIFAALKKNKMRTFLTAFGVFWGIFMLVIMLGSGRGLQNAVFDGMKDFATNSLFVWTQPTSEPYDGFPRGRRFYFRNDDIEALRNNIPEIDIIAPRLQAGGGTSSTDNVIRGIKTGSFTVNGDYPEWNLIDPVKMLDGRFLNHLDLLHRRKVAVIGDMVKNILFGKDEDPLGEYIRINGVYFQVVGVFSPLNSNIGFGGDKAQSIFIPFTTLQQTYNYGNIVGWFAITAREDIPVGIVDDKVRELLKRRHRVAPHDNHAIAGVNLEEQFIRVKGLFLGIDILVWIVGIGTLLAGVIGISNIMLIVVKERTKEIGIQRALGATPRKIISQIISESVFLTTIAGYMGLSLAVFLLELINRALLASGADNQAFKNPEVDLNIAIAALIILIVAGAFAGLMPANRAISIKPIDALRDE